MIREISNVSTYLDLFTTKRDRCRALLELSRRQATLIARDDYTGLLDVLGRKQLILAELDNLKTEHATALARWRIDRDGLDDTARSDCETVLAETETLVARLVDVERSSTESLAARRDTTRDELESLAGGAAVNDAYRDSLAPSTHRHLDLDT